MQQWMVKTGVQDINARICEKHFAPEDFGPSKKRRRLKQGAIRTLLLPERGTHKSAPVIEVRKKYKKLPLKPTHYI